MQPAATLIKSAKPVEDKQPVAPDLKSSRKLWLLPFILIVVFIVGLVSWGFYQWFTAQSAKPETSKTQLYKDKITIGYVSWPGYIGLIVARDKGFFKAAGLNVDVKSYPSLKDVSTDYQAGKIQGKANLTLEAIQEKMDGLDHRTVMVIDYSNGSDGIIAASNITSINQVKGKRVAYEFGTLEEFFLRYSLNEAGIDIKDLKPINLNPEEAAKAIIAKKADVAVTYEPFMSQAVKESKANKIYSSAQAPGLITDILTFRSDFINDNPETITALIKAYFQAIEFIKENPTEAHEILAKEYDTTGTEIADQLTGVKLLDQKDNEVAFTYSGGTQSLYGNMKQVGRFVQSQQVTQSAQMDIDSLIEPKFIKSFSQ